MQTMPGLLKKQIDAKNAKNSMNAKNANFHITKRRQGMQNRQKFKDCKE